MSHNQEYKIMDDSKQEDIRVGYQVAVDLASHESVLNWSRFNAMLVANSIVMAGIILILTGGKSMLIGRIVLPVAGVGLCIGWFLMTRRASKYYRHYLFSARELEEKHLANAVKTISKDV